jgi:hypothetical protein
MGSVDRASPPGEGRSLKRIPTAPIPLVCAIGIAMANLLPVQAADVTYDPLVLDFWLWYGTPVVLISVVLGVLPLPFMRELPERCRAWLLKPPAWAFALGVALLATIGALVMQDHAFQRMSGTADEIAQIFHSRILASGALSWPVDPNPEFLAIDNIVDKGRWYSQYPIGGVIALLPGTLIGAPWLVNPVLAGICVVGTYQFTRSVYGEVQGRVAAVILAQSQNLLLMSATYLNHLPTLTCAIVLMLALVEWERAETKKRRYAWAAVMGLAIGLMATVRQLDAIAFTIATGAFQLYVMRGDLLRYKEFLVQAAAGFIGVLPVFIANWRTTGSPLRFGYDMAWGEGHRIGFHVDPHGDMHDFSRGVAYAARYVSELNFATVAWPVPLGLVLIIGLLSMKKTERWDGFLLALIVAQLGAYGLYWGMGDLFGPRFLFTVLPAIVILAARAPFIASANLGDRAARTSLVLITGCVLVSWLAPHPASVSGFARRLPRIRQAFRVDLAGAAREAGAHNAVIFIREATSSRILHRMWGLGMPRDEAVRVINGYDSCTLLAGIRAAERDTLGTKERRLATLMRMAVALPDQQMVLGTRDQGIKFTSTETITDECRNELDPDDSTPAIFGPSLLLNEYDRDGRLTGDIIWLQDLSDHNEVLRKRFADRKWYRLVMTEEKDQSLTAKVVPY